MASSTLHPQAESQPPITATAPFHANRGTGEAPLHSSIRMATAPIPGEVHQRFEDAGTRRAERLSVAQTVDHLQVDLANRTKGTAGVQ
jgi:hypothetical protein